ncbi:MAG: hypothetical protein ABI690_14110 [Chloroflexota bacterium]
MMALTTRNYRPYVPSVLDGFRISRRQSPLFRLCKCEICTAADGSPILAIFAQQRRRFSCSPPFFLAHLAVLTGVPARYNGDNLRI